MSLEEIKDSFSNYSAKTLLLVIFGVLAPLSGTVYVGISTYNRVIAATEAIEEAKPYDDAEIRKYISALEKQNAELKTEIAAVKDNILSGAGTTTRLGESTTRVHEKASEAIGVAMEAKAVAQGSARETTAALSSIREEIKSMREGLEAKMKALQRATTNPLGN